MRLRQLFEAPTKTAAFALGRLNPATTGHELLVNAIKQAPGDSFLFLTDRAAKLPTDPLSAEEKLDWARKSFDGISVGLAKTVLTAADRLYKMGYREVTFLEGEPKLYKLLTQYNGVEKELHNFTFDKINYVQLQRDPEAEDATGMSASKLRQTVIDNDFEAFQKGVTQGAQPYAEEMFKKLQGYLGVDSVTESLLYEAATRQDADAMIAAIKTFQTAAGLKADGIVGKNTRAKAKEMLADPNQKETVVTLQNAVKAFQTKAGIDVDGRVGPQTMRAVNTAQGLDPETGKPVAKAAPKPTPQQSGGAGGEFDTTQAQQPQAQAEPQQQQEPQQQPQAQAEPQQQPQAQTEPQAEPAPEQPQTSDQATQQAGQAQTPDPNAQKAQPEDPKTTTPVDNTQQTTQEPATQAQAEPQQQPQAEPATQEPATQEPTVTPTQGAEEPAKIAAQAGEPTTADDEEERAVSRSMATGADKKAGKETYTVNGKEMSRNDVSKRFNELLRKARQSTEGVNFSSNIAIMLNEALTADEQKELQALINAVKDSRYFATFINRPKTLKTLQDAGIQNIPGKPAKRQRTTKVDRKKSTKKYYTTDPKTGKEVEIDKDQADAMQKKFDVATSPKDDFDKALDNDDDFDAKFNAMKQKAKNMGGNTKSSSSSTSTSTTTTTGGTSKKVSYSGGGSTTRFSKVMRATDETKKLRAEKNKIRKQMQDLGKNSDGFEYTDSPEYKALEKEYDSYRGTDGKIAKSKEMVHPGGVVDKDGNIKYNTKDGKWDGEQYDPKRKNDLKDSIDLNRYRVLAGLQENKTKNTLPDKIEVRKPQNPPKAPDATIPRRRSGYTTDAGVTYKQDKYNDNIMHVSDGSGTYTFDDARLIKWQTSMVDGLKYTYDYVQRKIKVDYSTTHKSDSGESLIDQSALYDMKGNKIEGSESSSVSAGGFSAKVDKSGTTVKNGMFDPFNNVTMIIKSNPEKLEKYGVDKFKKFTDKYLAYLQQSQMGRAMPNVDHKSNLKKLMAIADVKFRNAKGTGITAQQAIKGAQGWWDSLNKTNQRRNADIAKMRAPQKPVSTEQ